MRLVLLLFLLLSIPAVSFSATIYVPDDYDTIQEALDVAVGGDIVIVRPGTYIAYELDFNGKAVTLQSESGSEVTTIDGDYQRSLFLCQTGEGSGTVVEGFTLIHGTANLGGAFYCQGASPTIRNNEIRNCGTSVIACLDQSSPEIVDNHIQNNSGRAVYCQTNSSPNITRNIIEYNSGGGIYCKTGCNATITGNTIRHHQAGVSGIGIYCYSSSPKIYHNFIFDNKSVAGGDQGAAIFAVQGGSPEIVNNLIFDNECMNGGGIGITNFAGASIEQNTICNNTARNDGGGIYVSDNSYASVKNTIIWNNTASSGVSIYLGATLEPSTIDISFSDVAGGNNRPHVYVENGCTLNWGSSIIDADPLFITGPGDEPQNGFYLYQNPPQSGSDSPCVDAGSDLAANLGMDLLTTSTDLALDEGTVDLGFHYEPFTPPSGPDLVITSLTADTTSLEPGQSFTATFDVTNSGDEACGGESQIAFYLSKDDYVWLNDIFLGEATVPDLDPWGVHSASVSLNVGNNVGTWHLGGYADWMDVIPETQEYNGFSQETIDVNSLWSDITTISRTAGDDVTFDLRPGVDYDRRLYFLLGSMTGTSPGIPLPGGGVLPLTMDSFTRYIVINWNYPLLQGFRGYLDVNGEGTALFAPGPDEIPQSLIGRTLYFAFTTEYPYDFQSNVVTVDVVP